MDPEQEATARARLEEDYLSGAISSDEYMRLRRELHERASTPEPSPAAEPRSAPEREPTPEPERGPGSLLAAGGEEGVPSYQGAVPAGTDPLTGAALASWGQRAGAWFVDVAVLVAAAIASETIGVSTSIVLVFGPALYAWLMVGRWGQTVGKMALRIRVVKGEDADRVSYLRALGRVGSVWLLGVVVIPLVLAYLWPLWDRRNQTLYDKMARTIVVAADR